jgi:hypothetical protein
MCALQFASTLEINELNTDDVVADATEKLKDLHQLLVEQLD